MVFERAREKKKEKKGERKQQSRKQEDGNAGNGVNKKGRYGSRSLFFFDDEEKVKVGEKQGPFAMLRSVEWVGNSPHDGEHFRSQRPGGIWDWTEDEDP